MKSISIIVPVYNEENTVIKLINKIKKIKLPLNKEIIVIDDGSNDRSFDILKKTKGIKLIRHKQNLGKGASIKTGLKVAKGDYIVIQDADLEYDPEDIILLYKTLIEKDVDVVYGSRFLNKESFSSMPLSRYFFNKSLTFLGRILFGFKLSDVHSCYKLFKKKVLDYKELQSKGFGFDTEFAFHVQKKKYKYCEIPIKYEYRNYKEGKKITFLDGMNVFFWYLKLRTRFR